MGFYLLSDLDALGKSHRSSPGYGVAEDVLIVHELVKITVLHLTPVRKLKNHTPMHFCDSSWQINVPPGGSTDVRKDTVELAEPLLWVAVFPV